MAVHDTAEGMARALDRYAHTVERSAETVFRDAMKAAGQSLWINTPTDTGFLRSNWVIVAAGDEPPIGRFGSYAEFFAVGVFDSGARDAQAEAVGIRMIDAVNEAADKLQLGDVVELANATAYAIYIEGGHSQEQAPEGMLGPARQALEAYLASQSILRAG